MDLRKSVCIFWSFRILRLSYISFTLTFSCLVGLRKGKGGREGMEGLGIRVRLPVVMALPFTVPFSLSYLCVM